MYLPTTALQLLETLVDALPNQQLIVADFDALPDVQLPGTNAPLVAATVPSPSWLPCQQPCNCTLHGQTVKEASLPRRLHCNLCTIASGAMIMPGLNMAVPVAIAAWQLQKTFT